MIRPALVGIGGLALGLVLMVLGFWLWLGDDRDFAGTSVRAVVLFVAGVGLYGAVVIWWARLGGWRMSVRLSPQVWWVGGLGLGLVLIVIGLALTWPNHDPLGCCIYDGVIAQALWVLGLVVWGAVAIAWVWRGEPG